LEQSAEDSPGHVLSIAANQALALEISKLQAPEELREFLARRWAAVVARSNVASEALEHRVLGRLCKSLGNAHITTAKEYVVNEQLAANQYVGIGIVLATKDEWPVMTGIFEDGPADMGGAREGDLIEEVDGIQTVDKPMHEVVDLLRGPAGTQVRLALRQPSADERREVTLTRGVVPMKTLQYSRLEREGEATLGHIRVERIAASGPHELRRIEQALEDDVQGIILDLRGASDGEPHFGVLLANALLDGGSIGAVHSGQRIRTFEADRHCVFRSLPLALLVDERTSGTAEWVAAALQDNGRAKVVGRPTSGNSYVVEGVPVPGSDYVLVLRTGLLARKNGQPLVRLDTTPHMSVEEAIRADMMHKALDQRVRPDVAVESPAFRCSERNIADDPVLDRAAETLRRAEIGRAFINHVNSALARAAETLRQQIGPLKAALIDRQLKTEDGLPIHPTPEE
jgi:carboxyl-terminal processing protease